MIDSGRVRSVAGPGLLLALALGAVPAAAQEGGQQREHVVRQGDTLWDLAGQYLGNPFLWPMIYEANRSVVEDPHWIYPGERLNIPSVPGMAQGAPTAAVAEPAAEPAAPPTPARQQPAAPPVAAAEPAVGETMVLDLRQPLLQPAEYYSTPWLETDVPAATVGRVARLADQPSAARDQLASVLHPHDRINISAPQSSGITAGDTLVLVRLGRVVTGYGQVVEPLALVQVDTVGGGVVTGRLLLQFGEARTDDYVFRLGPLPALPAGRPEPVANGPQGRLVEFLNEQQLYGTGEYGFVTLAGQPLRPGDELSIFVPSTQLHVDGAETVPATEVGRATVIRVGERAATVRLTGVFDTAVRPGLPVRLVARMP